MRRIAVDLALHFISTILLSVFLYRASRDIIYAAVFISGGIFIDLDHLFDYLLFSKNKFTLSAFLNSDYLKKSGKFYMPLHSWELNFIIFLLSLASKSDALYLFSLGMAMHLAIDNIQRKNRRCYFIVYRFLRKFDVGIMLPEIFKADVSD